MRTGVGATAESFAVLSQPDTATAINDRAMKWLMRMIVFP
jgi:hypothetical protein